MEQLIVWAITAFSALVLLTGLLVLAIAEL